jgi:phosphoglycerol transferase MdoB-like AlkP superfamily enzyme
MEIKFKKSLVLNLIQTAILISIVFASQYFSVEKLYGLNFKIVLLNIILWSLILLFFNSVFNKQRTSLIVFIIFSFFFTLANRYKIKYLYQPLKVNDFSLGKDITGFVPLAIKYTSLKYELIFGSLGLIAVFFILKKIFGNHLQFKSNSLRLFCGTLSLMLLLTPLLNTSKYLKVINALNLNKNNQERVDNSRSFGVLFNFINELQYQTNNPPKNYSCENIKNIFANITPNNISTNQKIKPNIILILSESLWDPTQTTNISLTPDPLKNIRRDLKGNLVSPSIAGETANVEFEVLTGLNNYFIYDNAYPYTDLINKNTPSLFTLFKNNGYQTTAIHPYHSWFYNRDHVYQYFGLDKFISMDEMSDHEKAGPFISDKSFVKEILKQIDSSDQPQFVLGLSIQNHAPYEMNRFKDKQINISSNLNETDREIFQSYVDGIKRTNDSYLYLQQELQKLKDKPTIVILFGDHLPFLGFDFDIYKKIGFPVGDKLKIHSTPITLWSNYKKDFNEIGKISPAFLSNHILELADIKPQYQFIFTNELNKKTSILTKSFPNNNPDLSQMIDDYNLIQYDLIFGKQCLLN